MITTEELQAFPPATAKGFWITISAISATALVGLFLVPWMPYMPVAGLDPSWGYALNEAIARHLIFGRDFVFTLGPLGPVYAHVYNPATDTLMLLGSVLITIALCVGFAALVWGRRAHLVILLPIVVAAIERPDAWLLALPLLFFLVTFRLSSAPKDRLHLRSTTLTTLGISLLSCAVGILPLVKGTLLVLATVMSGLAVLTALIGRRRGLAFGLASITIVSLGVGWISAGQPLAALPRFFWAQKAIIAGYSEAMSVAGLFPEVVYWATATAAIIAIICVFLARRRRLAGWLVLLAFSLYSFVTFKEGFVRQEGADLLVSAESFLFIGLFLAALLDPLPAVAVAVIACLGWVSIERSDTQFGIATVLARIESRAVGAADGLILRVRSPGALPAMFNRANESIRTAEPLPRVEGTSDLYPFDLTLLFANRLEWDGRPTPQSYSAYTPELAEANAVHLDGSSAPTNIFFAVEAIDDRLPPLEDALSWPLLLSRYSIAALHTDYLQMKRRARPAPVTLDPPANVTARVNEWIDVPLRGGLVWTSIEMRPTFIGKLVLIAYKLPEVHVELRLANGQTVHHRYIPEMGQSGFLLSPYVGSTTDFALMAAGLDKGQDVRQIKIETLKTGLWPKRFSLSFRKLEIPPQKDLRQLLLAEPTSPPASISASEAHPIEDCAIDFIGGPLSGSLKRPFPIPDDHVHLDGWTAPNVQHGIGPDETWISLAGANGERRFYRAKSMPRPDVRAYFKQPGMEDPGFSANLDLSGLSGSQTLTIYSMRDNEAFRCSQAAVLELDSKNPDPAAR